MKTGIYVFPFLLALVLLDGTSAVQKRKRKYGCILPPEPVFGHFEFNDRFREITYKCDDGYLLFDMHPNYRKCKRNRRWSGQHGDCLLPYSAVNRCQKPDVPKHGTMHYQELEEGGAEATFYCDPGYKLVGSDHLICRDGNTWSGGSFPICRSQKTVDDLANILKEDFINPLAAATADSEDSGVHGKLSVGKRGLEIIFLLDVSASIGTKSLDIAKQFINIIVDQFGVSKEPSGGENGTRVALIIFSNKAKLVFNLDDPKLRSVEAVKDKINSVKSVGGGTNLIGALSMAMQISVTVVNDPTSEDAQTRAAESSKAVFIVTDAEATFNISSAKKDRQILDTFANGLKEDFEIFAIGIGSNIDHDVLTRIASHPKDEHVFMTGQFQDLGRVRDIIAEKNIDYGQCGISGRIEIQQGSQKSKKGAWPWVGWISVMMVKDTVAGIPDGAWTCGGALLCDRWFITVAHCVSYIVNGTVHPANIKTINVNLGDHDLFNSNPDDNQIIMPVERILLHPNYTGVINEHEVREYDVALLDLGKLSPLELNKNIRPLCYPTKEKGGDDDSSVQKISDVMLLTMLRNSSTRGFVAGWGHAPNNVNNYHSRFPWDVMYQDKRSLQPHRKCQKRFPGLDENLFFCVFNSFGESDYCRGDVGGPLMAEMPNSRFVVLGLAARTYDCNKGDISFSIFHNVVNPVISDWVGGHLKGCNRVKEDPKWTKQMKTKRKELEKLQKKLQQAKWGKEKVGNKKKKQKDEPKAKLKKKRNRQGNKKNKQKQQEGRGRKRGQGQKQG